LVRADLYGGKINQSLWDKQFRKKRSGIVLVWDCTFPQVYCRVLRLCVFVQLSKHFVVGLRNWRCWIFMYQCLVLNTWLIRY